MAFTFLACNSLSGVGELTEIACVNNCEPIRDDGTSSGSSTSSASSSGGSDGGQPDARVNDGRPSFCRGILMYVPFDADAKTKAGLTPVQSSNTDITFGTPGKFGGGASFDPDDALFYSSTTLHHPTAGSVAVWIKPMSTAFGTRALFRPQINSDNDDDAADTVAPSLWAGTTEGSRVGMELQGASGVEAVVQANSTPSGVKGWSTVEFHLMVGTWNAAATGAAPTLTYFVKNSTAETTASSTAIWTPRQATTPVVRIGTEFQNVKATLDDFAIWDHPLTLEESRALFASTVSLGTACNL